MQVKLNKHWKFQKRSIDQYPPAAHTPEPNKWEAVTILSKVPIGWLNS